MGSVATGPQLYDRVADEAAAVVIRGYSTSFGAAARLLAPPVRRDVRNIYALVRVADELVDGGLDEAGSADAAAMLDEFEAETERAIGSGSSANLIAHAFARTARRTGFGTELTRPFFASMRADLTVTSHDDASFRRYVYGSAEVVGLMCLFAFQYGEPPKSADHQERMVSGARALGAAFQKVNFLRDLAADYRGLGRCYFPGLDPATLTEVQKIALVDDIDAELERAGRAIPDLPAGSRRAVALAHGLFADLAARLRRTPAKELVGRRVRVPNPVKARIALAAVVRG